MHILQRFGTFLSTRFFPWLVLQVSRLRRYIVFIFSDHPKVTGETYFQHLWFAIGMTARLLFTSIALITHGFFPFVFTRTASKQIEKIYAIMKARLKLIHCPDAPAQAEAQTNEAIAAAEQANP